MKTTACRYIMFSALLTSMSLSASQEGLSKPLSFSQSLSHTVQSSTKERATNRSNGASVYFLVNDVSPYSGDTLSLGRRKFEAIRNGNESSGRYFIFGNLLLLWNGSLGDLQFITVYAIDRGIWKSCWADTPGSARACDASSDLVYIFTEESAASNFQNNEQQEDEQPLAMGPDNTADGESEAATDTTAPPEESNGENQNPQDQTPDSEAESQQPEPAPETQQPEPAPETQQPEPAPEAQQPEPVVPPATDESDEPAPDAADPPAETDDSEPATSEEIPASTNFAAVACAAPAEELKAALLQATNESRSQGRSCGTNTYPAASALIWNDSLARAAKRHSNDMSSNNFFSHSGSDGLQVWDRANAENYQYRYIGENIAAGQRTVGEVQNGWIDSPGHCANIMNQQIVEMGAACVVDPDSDYRTYWTVVVGESQ